MKQVRIFLFLLILVLSGVNYSLFVNKERIVNTRVGYLVYYRDQQIFFSVKRIKEEDQFSQIEHLTGYEIHFEQDAEVYKSIANKYYIGYTYRYGSEILTRKDSMGIMPMEIRSLPYHHKGEKELYTLTVNHNETPKQLRYYNSNNEGVLSVYPVLKKDLKRLADYYR